MALAPAAYVLWTRFLRHNPRNPDWADRDRFVLSCGHASMLLYSLLHLTGYDLSLEDIKAFRQWGSKTPGHPERGHTPGVETTTGPLGQGVGNAVGMAIAERLLAEHFNRPGHRIVDHRTWAFASDGDLMEGVGERSRLARRAPPPRQAHPGLRRQPHHHRRRHGAHLLRGRASAGSRPTAGTWSRSATATTSRPSRGRSMRRRGKRPPDADGAPHPHRRSRAHQAEHRRGARRAAGRGRGAADQGDHGLAEEPTFFVPDDALRHWREAVDSRRRARGRLAGAPRGCTRRHIPTWRPSWSSG